MKKNKKIGLRLAALSMTAIAALLIASCDSEQSPTTTSTDTSQTTTTTPVVELDPIYASPNGSSDNNGSKGSPYDIRTGFTNVQPGQTLYLLGGTYALNQRIFLEETRSGKAGQMISVKAYDNQAVTIDFSEQPIDSTSRGIQVNGNYWYFYGIDVKGAGDNGMYIAGSYNIVENCTFHENQDTGLQIGRASSLQANVADWPHNNLIKNCTSYNNYDYQTYGENADGFAAKLTCGEGNVFDGCIAYRNSDDGWDMYAKSDSGNVGTTVLINCVSFENGWLLDKTATPDDSDLNEYGVTTMTTTAKVLAKKTNMSYTTRDGDGIGFKLGGSIMEGNVIVENCLAFNNRLHGFSDNSNPGVLSLRNCTAYNNAVTPNPETGEVGPNSNSSNNFDCARSDGSYNNYYGLLSYTTNQTDPLISYNNSDAYRGAVGYSIFNLGRNKYYAFQEYKDGSSYVAAKLGTAYNGMSDSIFKTVNFAYNPNGDRTLHSKLRNADGSVNMGDYLDVVDADLLKYCEGKQIGSKLNYTSADQYNHYGLTDFTGTQLTETQVALQEAKDVLEIMCNPNAVYQNVNLLTTVNGCSITWASSNDTIVECGRPMKNNPNEFETITSVSGVTYIEGIIHRDREKDQMVTLTATISLNDEKVTKQFNLNIKRNVLEIGAVSGLEDRYILTQFSDYSLPKISVLNASSYSGEELIEGIDYQVENSIYYANSSADFASGNYYEISKVYTSLAGVYKINYTITSLISSEQFDVSCFAYVVSEEASIDVSKDEAGSPEIEFNVSRDGVQVSANFTNILGNLYVYASSNETETAAEIVSKGKAYSITDESLDAIYEMPNNAEYYVHVCVNNKKNTIENPTVYSKQITIQTISTNDEFHQLVTGSTSSTVIYLLQNDLDFAGYNWETSTESFGGLFNGNGKTIKNITINGKEKKDAAIIYCLKKGTLMNVSFDNITINGASGVATVAGIVGQMCGGYIHNVSLHNISVNAHTGAGGLVGQVTGNSNYITQVSLVNDNPSMIYVTNKYCGGIVGNLQKDTAESRVSLYVSDVYVNAVIGDGKDAGGYIGGVIGRNKNEFDCYSMTLYRCVFEGQVMTGKDYSGGIFAGCDNGAGNIHINSCAANCTILLKGVLLDGVAAMSGKNDSPVWGRVTKGAGTFIFTNNYGLFCDSQFATEYETFAEDFKTRAFFYARLVLDLENIWNFDEATCKISLKSPSEILAK